jgi:hypothetical protein
MRSPSRKFWLRGNFSIAGTSHMTEPIRDIRVRVAFDVLNVVSGTAGGVFSRDASVFVSSRVLIMHAG